jgi:hypothetical protein
MLRPGVTMGLPYDLKQFVPCLPAPAEQVNEHP